MHLGKKLSFLNRLSMRAKANLIVVLILLLAGVGTLGYLIQTGKLGSKADTGAVTVTITGKYINTITGKAVIGAKIEAHPMDTGQFPTVTTDSYGKYKAVLTIYPSINSFQKTIRLRQYMPGYPEDGIGTQFDVKVPDTTSSSISITQNFKLAPIPQDIVSTNQLDPTSQRCRTDKSKYDYEVSSYHTGDYKGEVVNGVLICTALANQGFLTSYSIAIDRITVQIDSLVARTQLPYTPVIYLSGPLVWEPGAAAYVMRGGKEIIADIAYIDKNNNDPWAITHEFGHLVDWFNGPDMPFNDSSCINKVNISKTKSHCMLTDSRPDFISAASISWHEGLITGYATSNRAEMFAEIFAAQQTPDSAGSSNFSKREKAQYNIKNALFAEYKFPFNPAYASSLFNTDSSISGQNAGMYIYKFVASAGKVDQYFSGDLKSSWTYNDIWYGNYMTTGVVSIQLNECQVENFGGTNVTVGDVTGQTRTQKTSGVFTDGSGDLFDDSGTVFLMNVPLENQALSVSGFLSTTTTPNSLSIVHGSNDLATVKTSGNLGFNYSSKFGSYGTEVGQFTDIKDIAISPVTGNIFAIDNAGLDSDKSRVEAFDNNGKFLTQFGKGNIPDATRIAVGEKDTVYVLANNFGNPKIVSFKDGKLYNSFGLGYAARDIATDAYEDDLIYVLTADGRGFRNYSSNGTSWAAAIFSQNNLNRFTLDNRQTPNEFGIDITNKVVREYGNFGGLIGTIGTVGGNSQTGSFLNPIDIVVDSVARIYVLDGTKKNVQVFDKTLKYLTSFSLPDPNSTPVSLAIGPDGKVTVGYSNLTTSTIP